MLVSDLIIRKEVEVQNLLKEAEEEMSSGTMPTYVKLYDMASYEERIEKLESEISLLKSVSEE